jgi:hypothetical protein
MSIGLRVPLYEPLVKDLPPGSYPQRGSSAVCEQLEGTTLASYLANMSPNPSSLKQALQMISEATDFTNDQLEPLARGIPNPLGRGFIIYDHRDTGSQNILLSLGEQPALVDIEGHHFSIQDQPPPSTGKPPKRHRLLESAAVDIDSNPNLATDQKASLIQEVQSLR